MVQSDVNTGIQSPTVPLVEESSERVVENDVPDSHKRKTKDYLPEYADIASQLVAAHFTEQDLAYAFDVSKRQIKLWKKHNPLFRQACEDGKREQKKRLVARAFKQAMGYKFTDTNTKRYYNAEGKLIKVEESSFGKENPGNERLLVFLLCNLDRQLGDDDWKSIQRIEVDENKTVRVEIDGKAAKEQIKRLAGDILETERKQIECKVVA
jgi:hypothetical protein